MKRYLKAMGAAAVFMALGGCGDDGGGGASGNYLFPAGKATLVFTAMSTARLAAPVSGIDFAITLPAGMSVTTTSGVSGPIASASVTPGSALVGTNLAFGTYSASNGKTRLSMVTASNSFRKGEFLQLTCTVANGSGITLAGLQALNNPTTLLKAVGYNPADNSTVALTGSVKVTMDAVRTH